MGALMTTTDPIDLRPTPSSILSSGAPIEAREEQLVEGADRLASARHSVLSHPRLLVGAAATLMTTGIGTIILGWIGASRTTFVEEQVPYVISGGLLGAALSTVGALLFFTHWLTISIKEARDHEAARRLDEAARRLDHEELIETLKALGGTLGPAGSQRWRRSRREPSTSGSTCPTPNLTVRRGGGRGRARGGRAGVCLESTHYLLGLT